MNRLSEISGRLGKPMHDGPQLVTRRRLLSVPLARIWIISPLWLSGAGPMNLIYRSEKPLENRWRVSISQGSSKLEYIINFRAGLR